MLTLSRATDGKVKGRQLELKENKKNYAQDFKNLVKNRQFLRNNKILTVKRFTKKPKK